MPGVRLLAFLLAAATAGVAAPAPGDLPRLRICLNGDWDVALSAPADRIPDSGFLPRRVPEFPLATDPPVVSAWYRYRFAVPRAWVKPGRRFILRIDKAGHYAAIYCNGRQTGEHYGQYTPFAADIASSVRPGEVNEVAIFVHNAGGKYARPGAEISDPMEANAYRGATDRLFQRNWTGITGDIFLEWRPETYIADVRIVSSVRKHELTARVETGGAAAPGTTLRADVLDGSRRVLSFPERPLEKAATLSAPWADPVLWGPEPYGQPKLYVLRTELLRGGKVVDRSFTRFGFREVWIDGRDVLLNGKKLWMAGTYFGKLAPIRYSNDRRPQARILEIMQAAGLNTLHGHWDELGEPWLDRCDEAGMLVLAGFYCDGRPQIQSKADAGWEDWMAAACRDWVRVARRHPSIVMWRPADVVPQNVTGRRPGFFARLAAEVRAEDGTRPLADDSDIDAWSQSPLKNPQPGAGPRTLTADDYDDASRMAERLAKETKPLLTKEIYAGFQDFENLATFFRVFYEKSFQGGGAGIIVQHLPLFQAGSAARAAWPSQSGEGNREPDPVPAGWKPSAYSQLFAELYRKYRKRPPAAAEAETAGELLISGLAANDVAFLVPEEADRGEAYAVRAAADGTAWMAAAPGPYRLYYAGESRPAKIAAHSITRIAATAGKAR